MGRNRWANTEQLAFLESRWATLERDHQDQTLTAIYTQVTAAFIEQWPSPLPVGDKFEGWTPARLKSHADERRGRVSLHTHFLLLLSIYSLGIADYRVVQEASCRSYCLRPTSAQDHSRFEWEGCPQAPPHAALPGVLQRLF